ncbi:hypothetical protein GCM10028895_05150 [Pontibacter rugosus]
MNRSLSEANLFFSNAATVFLVCVGLLYTNNRIGAKLIFYNKVYFRLMPG